MKRFFFIMLAAVALALMPGTEKPGVAADTVMRVEPASSFVSPGSGPFDIQVRVDNVQTPLCALVDPTHPCGLGSYTIRLAFNPTVIACEDLDPGVIGCQNVTNGPFLTSTGRRVDATPGFCAYDSPGNDPANGVIKYSCISTGNPPGSWSPLGPEGSGLLATLRFRPVQWATGTSALDLQDTILPNFQGTRLGDIMGTEIAHTTQDGSVTVNYVADLSVSKTAPASVAAPGNVTYNIQVSNAGPDAAANVTAVDSLPSQVVFQSASAGCSYDGGQHKVTCTLSTINVSQSKSVSITTSVAAAYAGQTLSNTVDVTTTVADPVTSNNHAVASTQVQPSNMSINKMVPIDVGLSEVAPYTIAVTSTGASAAAAVQVVDVLPSQVEYVGATSTIGSCSYDSPTRTVTCSLGDMASGASATVTIQVRFGSVPAVVCNTATVKWTPLKTSSTPARCTFVAQPDSDGDGCRNINESQPNPLKGGNRNPNDPYDFFDVVLSVQRDPVPNGLATGYGQSNKDTDEDLGRFAANTSRAQGFKLNSTDLVDRVLLYLGKQGAPSDSLTLEIQTDSGGLPSGTVVWDGTSAPVSGAGLGASYGWVAFAFPRSPVLSAGTQYHLVLKRSGGTNGSNYYQWGGDISSPSYPNGAASVYNGSSWTAPQNDDKVFYVLAAKDRAVSLLDVLMVLRYVPSPPPGGGTLDTPNVNGVAYNADKNLDGVPDGQGYDRTLGSPFTGPPDQSISLLDVLAALKQVPHSCAGAP